MRSWAIGVAIFLAFFVSSGDAQESCVQCHDDYAKVWSESVHALSGVTCSKCMGGDPGQSAKELAHAGVKPASDPASTIYYKNIPSTCGACHEKQLSHFRGSAHYKNLEGNKLAPDCRTCHGSMGIIEVVPIKISDKCSELCHNSQVGAPINVPGQAKKLFLLQEQVNGEIKRAERAVSNARLAGVDVKDGENSLDQAKAVLTRSGETWHKFNLKNFENELYDALYYAYRAENQVGFPTAPAPTQQPRKSICGPTAVLLLASLIAFTNRRLSASRQGA